MHSSPSSTQPNHADPDGLIRTHLPLAYRLAACYRGSGRSYADLVRVAQTGLVRAAERFDATSGGTFRAFAAPLISAELTQSLRRPGRPGEEAGQLPEAQRRISAALSHSSRVRELARLLAVDGEVMAEALLRASGREAVTLNLPARRRSGAPVTRLRYVSARPAAA